MEKWAVIPFTENIYYASDIGRIKMIDNTVIRKDGVKRFKKGKILNFIKQPNGYLYVSIRINGKTNKTGVHRLVAMAYHKTEDYSLNVLHNNNIKFDNRKDNVRWGTQKQNVQDAFEAGVRKMGWGHFFSKHPASTYIQIFYLYQVGVKRGAIAKMLNLPTSTVFNIMYNYEKHKLIIDKMFLQ